MASAIACVRGTRLCGDGERSDQARSGTADATLDGDGDGHVWADTIVSGGSSLWPIVVCVFRCNWLKEVLLRVDEDAALTAADAGVTVIATDVLTNVAGRSACVVVLEVEEGLGGLDIPF